MVRPPSTLACAALALVVACGGPTFTLAADAAVVGDGGATDSGSHRAKDGAPAESGRDGAHDGSLADGASADAGPVCDVFVMAMAPGPGEGTTTDPFPTIAAAISSVTVAATTKIVTICVRPGGYTVTDLVIPSNVVLFGISGPKYTSLTGSSTVDCQELTMPPTPCAVRLGVGSALAGFRVSFAPAPGVKSKAGDGIVTGAHVAGKSPPGLADVTVDGLEDGNGIIATGDLNIGVSVNSTNNKGGNGLAALALGNVIVAGDADFSGNAYNGIEVENATLSFAGGSVSNNGGSGIRLGQTTAGKPASVVGLMATGNGEYGLAAYAGNLTLRASNLGGNALGGLYYNYGESGIIGTLDIGGSVSPGKNTFHVSGSAKPSTGVGVFLCDDKGPATVSVHGDIFGSCPPTSKQFGMCGLTAPASPYVDVAYAPTSTGGDPVNATTESCP